uniref:T-cell activation inhibitor, mitochondrial n=1 Tax=Ditylenchus dipsaci TaxID=166011 RepID=A0A915CQY6_9BILA
MLLKKLHHSPLRNLLTAFVLCRRKLSAQQAAVALRPFYFVVHPDRFGRDPITRDGNEKALQVFNGYLNDLFPHPSSSLKPVQVKFAIKKNGTLENVCINLSGGDPNSIIRSVLEKCHLSTEHVPKIKTSLYAPGFNYSSAPQSSSASPPENSDLWRDLHARDRHKKASTSNTLFASLIKKREDALARTECYDRTTELLNDEMEHIILKTGVNKIVWTINWEQRYMRRCLVNIQNMLSHADQETKHTLTHALCNKVLILGRGSFVCCDGSLQFGADDATGAWQKVCLESNIRRFEVTNLGRLVQRVETLLGNATLLVNPYGNLLTTTHQMHAIIVRMHSMPALETSKIKHLACNSIIEIVTGYHELAVLRDGRLQIPCTVNGDALIEFLELNAKHSWTINQQMHRKETIVQDLCCKVCKVLRLRCITWDSQLDLDQIVDCLNGLNRVDDCLKNAIDGLGVHLSTNPTTFVMSDGKVSIPIHLLL